MTTTTQTTRPAEFDAAVAAYIPAMQKRAWLFRKTSDAADDLVQDTLEEALRRWHGYDKARNFYGWLCMMMRNVTHAARRKGGLAMVDNELAIEHQSTPPAQEWSTDLRAAVATISGLPDGAELLEHAAGATMAEIGERTGISRQRVEQKIKRARAVLVRGVVA